MELKENHISCSKTYRYFTLGNILKAKYLLYALHGYGQLGTYFSRKFEGLSEDYFIVIPEGLHRFYLKGTSGRVGASWMTKEDRELDISDNLNWLNTLDDSICREKSFLKKMIVGFSQGGATAARWHDLGTAEADHLILWASIYPTDLSQAAELKVLDNKKENHFILGNKDEYFTEQEQKETLEKMKELGFMTHTYDGNHTIDGGSLKIILAKYIEKT
jgi:predicted esterase